MPESPHNAPFEGAVLTPEEVAQALHRALAPLYERLTLHNVCIGVAAWLRGFVDQFEARGLVDRDMREKIGLLLAEMFLKDETDE